MVKSSPSITFLIWTLFASPALAQCVNLPGQVKDYLMQNPRWSLVDVKDLVADDRALWQQYHKGLCPGLAIVGLDDQAAPYFALALWRRNNKHSFEKLVVLPPRISQARKAIFVMMDTDTRTSVVWRAGPGSYEDVVTGRRENLKHDAIIYETMEAGAIAYYLSHGRFKSIQTSE